MSACCVTISNPESLSSCETVLNPKIGSWKSTHWIELNVRKPLVVLIFTKNWRAETLQHGLEFDSFKPRPKSSIFKCNFWLNGTFFERNDRGFLKEIVKTYLMSQISFIHPPIFSIFTSIVYNQTSILVFWHGYPVERIMIRTWGSLMNLVQQKVCFTCLQVEIPGRASREREERHCSAAYHGVEACHALRNLHQDVHDSISSWVAGRVIRRAIRDNEAYE